MSDQIPVGEYTQSFDMATHAFIIAYPIEVSADGVKITAGANLITGWANVAERPDLVAAALRRTANAIEAGSMQSIIRPMGPDHG